jgi:hypothetical protein
MKKFSVKDFISYNSPCFSCNSAILVRVGVTHRDLTVPESSLRPFIQSGHTEIDLQITYNSMLKMAIDHKTNKFAVNDIGGLTKYLEDHKLFLELSCNKCYTTVTSQHLEFDLIRRFIKAVGISQENLITSDDSNMYQIHSSFIKDVSLVYVTKIDRAVPVSPIQFETPLMPLGKFKNKEHLINKLKLYATFS